MTDNDPVSEFFQLLDQELDEQKYQEFLENDTRFIPREFIQNHGVHFDLVFRKLSFARDYQCDFFYLSKSSDDWNCVLVEIEKPQSRFFKSGTNKPHKDLLTALDQINRWRAWMGNASNVNGFINGTIESVRTPLTGNPCHIKYVLVFGRRSEYEKNAQRRAYIRGLERDDFKIVTFDSLAEAIHSKHPLYVAARKNEFVDILSSKYVDDSIFAWMQPEQLRITKPLRADIELHKNESRSFRAPRFGKDMVNVLIEQVPKILDSD